ncbi:MAG: hypothetical protein KatS3mg115_0478 [Candidatus Poribacteria bacterium]|nr:MAG: hypothetical protein KatS3mg115_0478 [Candidatus Poribacteria bacterium]
MAGLARRFWNFLTGWLRFGQSRLESTRPEIVYDQAIREQRKKYQKLEEAVAGLVYNRNQLQEDLREAQQELDEVQRMLEQAIQDARSDDRARAEEAVLIGTMLQEQEEALQARIAELTESLDVANARIEEYQEKLVEFQARIRQLEQEKAHAVAQARMDQETIRLQRELSGMVVDDSSEALQELRQRLGRLHAQATMVEEIRGKSLEERLNAYRRRARSESARTRFLERVQERRALEGEKTASLPGGASSEGTTENAARNRFLERVREESSRSSSEEDPSAEEPTQRS